MSLRKMSHKDVIQLNSAILLLHLQDQCFSSQLEQGLVSTYVSVQVLPHGWSIEFISGTVRRLDSVRVVARGRALFFPLRIWEFKFIVVGESFLFFLVLGGFIARRSSGCLCVYLCGLFLSTSFYF